MLQYIQLYVTRSKWNETADCCCTPPASAPLRLVSATFTIYCWPLRFRVETSWSDQHHQESLVLSEILFWSLVRMFHFIKLFPPTRRMLDVVRTVRASYWLSNLWNFVLSGRRGILVWSPPRRRPASEPCQCGPAAAFLSRAAHTADSWTLPSFW